MLLIQIHFINKKICNVYFYTAPKIDKDVRPTEEKGEYVEFDYIINLLLQVRFQGQCFVIITTVYIPTYFFFNWYIYQSLFSSSLNLCGTIYTIYNTKL